MQAFAMIMDGNIQRLSDVIEEKYGNNVILQNATGNAAVSVGGKTAQPFNLVADASLTLLAPPSSIFIQGTNTEILNVLVS